MERGPDEAQEMSEPEDLGTATDFSNDPRRQRLQQSLPAQHETPTARRVAGGGLGLRASSIHTPENASAHSGRSALGPVLGESKPSSQKSSGMSLVSRLRRLSSAALHGKVNRLFSRSNNASQDSLLMGGATSPSSSTMPGSPTTCPAANSDLFRGRRVPSYAMCDYQVASASLIASNPAAEWRSSNAYNLPPLPPKPLSSRRNRAMTEVTPLVVRGRLETTEGEPDLLNSGDGEDGSAGALQKLAHSRSKAANSPLVASPLSRKSFHTLNSAGSVGKGTGKSNSPPYMAKSTSEHQISSLLSPSTQSPQRLVPAAPLTPSVESPFGSMLSLPRPPMPHRQSYRHSEYHGDDRALRAANTPSPPDKTKGHSQAHFTSDLGTPTLQHRRAALATPDWASHNGVALQPPRLGQRALPPPLPPQSHPQQQQHSSQLGPGAVQSSRLGEPRADSPSSMLSVFQTRLRIDSGQSRLPSVGTSARSSTSIASDSAPSWVSAMSNVDSDRGGNGDDADRGKLACFDEPSLDCEPARQNGGLGGGLPESAAFPVRRFANHQRWTIPAAGLQALHGDSMAEWQVSQNDSGTALSHSPLLLPLGQDLARAYITDLLPETAFGEHGRCADSHGNACAQPSAVESLRSDRASSRSPLNRSIVGMGAPMRSALSEADELDNAMSSLSPPGGTHESTAGGMPSYSTPTSSLSAAQAVRPRGVSQTVHHLARAATTNAIRLKEKGGGQAGVGPVPSASKTNDVRAGPGSAPETLNIDLALQKSKARLRVRATSASHQSFAPIDVPLFGRDGLSSGYSSGSGTIHLQHGTLGKSGTSSGPPTSRPPSAMSTYTMSPMSSTAGEDSQHAMMAHLWQPAAMFRSSPERSGDNHLAGAGMYTPSSTSSPPAHFHISGTHGHQLRLNTSSVQRSSSGHSVSSGISELLEPSSVSQARKDTLWQALVVSKSRADAEIDKIMRQWRETENGVIVCALDVDPKPGVGDDDAIILKVKRGHRRSISDIKRADGDKNEFRRRVIELAGVIRSSTVAELSNEKFTRGITEQLYGLLTEQRTRFPSDSNVSSLILDVLYQFSAVPQTVSQMAIPVNTHTSGLRATVSGDASPAASQFPSPLLAPDASLGRGALGHIQPLSSALSSQYEIASARNASHGHQLLASPASALGDFGDYRTARTVSGSPAQGAPHLQRCYQGSTSDSYLLSGPATRGMQPLGGSVPYVSSPRLVPGTAHSSTASLLSLLAPVHGGAGASGSIGRAGMAGGNVFGQTQSAAGLQQRQRSYIPSSVGTPHSSRLSIDTPDSEIELPARQSMDDANMRPPLRRHASKLSVSSDAADTYSFSYRPAARASLQQHQFYQQVSKQHPPAFPYHTAQQPTSQEPFSLTLSGRECEAAALVTPKRVVRPATMYISGSGGHASLRHFSESFLRQEKLASLLGQESDYSDSVPTSPAEPPARPFLDFDLFKRDTLKLPADALRTIPEARRGSDVDACSLLERQLDASTAAGDEVHALVVEGAAGTLQVLDGSDQVSNNNPLAVDGAAITVDSREANSAATVLGLESEAVLSAEDNMVVCRICDREFFRSELNAHSDVCILEQTRAMKLDEVNQRIKRLRDSISKRLLDIKKTRQWDRVAIRESERIIRIANRSIAWPEGDSQHEQIVAKAKFTKYIDRLETITGRSSSEPAPAPVNCCQIDDVTPQPAGVAATTLPRADVETIWLAMHLLVRVQEKFTIIEEFDKEFSRLEQQEALVREAESLNDDVSTEPVAPFLELPTWSQLAQTTRGSPAASERTSIDYMPSQSESGSATPDVSTPYSVGPGKGAITLTRRHSRHSRPDRRSLSRSARQGADIADGDSHSNGSGSRKLVSLFAALFRNNSVVGGFGRGKDAASSTSLLRRKNTPSPFASSALQPGAKAGSVLRRLSQNVPVAQAAKPLSAIPGAGSGHNTPSELIDGTCPATPASPADAPLASPVTRQRNNSQLASLRATPESAAKAPRMPSIDEFDFVKPISRGAFGRVYLARKKATKDLYAIKVMRKKDMIIKNMVTQALAERRALSLLSTEWVVQLYYAFHSSKHLFLVMEYLVGGDLAGLLRVRGVMQDDEAKFYIAEIGCAIDYLHRNSIVHRDIKPDNVILASDGHIKLTDFGLSQVAVRGNADTKPLLDGSETNSGPESPLSSDTARAGDSEGTERLVDKTDEYWSATLSMPGLGALATSSTANGAPATKALPQSKRAHARKSSRGFLGTPDYLAPELLLGAGNGLAVDWWALGVCLFEFMCGYPPFTDESPEAIFRNILNHAIDWPEEEGYVSEVAIELINSLLRPDPATRSHWKDIKSARLYEGWDLNNIRQMEPPLVPQPDDDVDTSYFESCQRSEIQRLSNATFLQIDNARRPPPPPPLLPATKKGDVATLPDPGSESQDDSQHGSQRGSQGGSYRGSRRGRVASGSASALCGPGAAVSEAGQLQKLFEAVSASSKCADDDHKPCTGEGIAADSQVLPRLTGSIATTSSSGNYSFTHDGGTSLSEHSEQFLGERLESRVAQTRPLSADGLAIANELGLDGEHNSINSLSEPEVEPAMLPGQGDIALVRPASRPETVSAARPVSAVVLSPVLPISFARRAISRSPSQHSDGILETATGHSGSTSKSHSRCASATVMLVATKKGTGTTKAKRPSHSNEYASESEYSAALVRSSSADERLQCAASGSGSALVLSPGGGGSVASSNAGNDCTDDNESEERDEDAERAFEDFTYKNLALLSHVNKGVSSSGHGTPTVERPPPGLPALSLAPAVAPVAIPSHRSSVYSSVSGNFRGSPINAYDIKQPTQSPDAC